METEYSSGWSLGTPLGQITRDRSRLQLKLLVRYKGDLENGTQKRDFVPKVLIGTVPNGTKCSINHAYGWWHGAKRLIVAFALVMWLFPSSRMSEQPFGGTYQCLAFLQELFQDLEICRDQSIGGCSSACSALSGRFLGALCSNREIPSVLASAVHLLPFPMMVSTTLAEQQPSVLSCCCFFLNIIKQSADIGGISLQSHICSSELICKIRKEIYRIIPTLSGKIKYIHDAIELKQVALLPEGREVFIMPLYAPCKIKVVLIDLIFKISPVCYSFELLYSFPTSIILSTADDGMNTQWSWVCSSDKECCRHACCIEKLGVGLWE